MEKAQRDKLLNLLKQFDEIDIEELAGEAYQGSEIASIEPGGYSISEIIVLLKRSVKQLQSELEGQNWQGLPMSYSHPEQGASDLFSMLQHILSHITSKHQFNHIISQVIWLVGYQMDFAFWNTSKMKLHNVDEEKLIHQQTQLSLLSKDIESRINDVDKLKKELIQVQAALVDFQTQKQQEFQTIASNQAQSNQLLSEIRSFQNEANSSRADITAILEQQKQYLEDVRQNLNQDRKTFNDFKAEYEVLNKATTDRIKLLDDQTTAFNSIIEHAQKQDEFLRKKEEEITKLTGFAADASLGHTFNRRERQLQVSVWIWAGLSIAITGGALWWVYHVFQTFPTHINGNFSWSETVLNVMRTAPGFILMYFAISQYSKERNLQEEYAFKAAVAMTVTAYTDMLSEDGDKQRDLITQTVQGIYVPPQITKDGTPIIFSTKHLADATKNLADATEKLKGAVNLKS